ncbi:MAG: hypothetical protein NVS2B4_19840 [Ramlibacter sp.]
MAGQLPRLLEHSSARSYHDEVPSRRELLVGDFAQMKRLQGTGTTAPRRR